VSGCDKPCYACPAGRKLQGEYPLNKRSPEFLILFQEVFRERTDPGGKYVCKAHYNKLNALLKLDERRANNIGDCRGFEYDGPAASCMHVQLDRGRLHGTVSDVYRPLLLALLAGNAAKISQCFSELPENNTVGDMLVLSLKGRFDQEFKVLRSDSMLGWQPKKQPEKSRKLVCNFRGTLEELHTEFQLLSPSVLACMRLMTDKEFDPVAEFREAQELLDDADDDDDADYVPDSDEDDNDYDVTDTDDDDNNDEHDDELDNEEQQDTDGDDDEVRKHDDPCTRTHTHIHIRTHTYTTHTHTRIHIRPHTTHT
jgi:hypothetical protein